MTAKEEKGRGKEEKERDMTNSLYLKKLNFYLQYFFL
jgi:hypothetical protein